MVKILITGGAGYVGSSLAPLLLEKGFDVTIYDNLMYGGDGILQLFSLNNFTFVKGDIRNKNDLTPLLKKADIIIHLASIVGYPACNKDPILAKQVNEDSTKFIVDNVTKDQLLLYASTGSNYGAVRDTLCTEETPLNPLTVYGKTKVVAEKYITESKTCNSIVFRFATAFGISPRLRLDLLINDFVYQVMKNNYLLVYEKDYWRTFIHVLDMGRAFLFAIENKDKMLNEVYNVGDEKLNFTKGQIAEIIKKYKDYYLHFVDEGKDEDQRDYEVSYEKIRKTGFKLSIDHHKGIKELIRAMDVIDIPRLYSNAW